MPRTAWTDWLAAAAVAAAASGHGHACTVREIARMPLATYDGVPVVGVTLDGTTIPMILDTGAQFTVITPQAASSANLQPDKTTISRMQGIRGAPNGGWNYDARVTTMSVGGLEVGARRVHVGEMLGAAAGNTVGGALGADILARHDLELDLRHAQASLYSVSGCVGDFVPWTERHDIVPSAWSNREQTQMEIPASIDGMPVRTFIDTGASVTMLTRTAAMAAGADDRVMTASSPVRTLDATGLPIAGRSVTFKTAQIGAESFRNARLVVCDCRIPDADLQIGEDYIAGGRRLWLSYSTGAVFIERAGGGRR